MKKFEDWFKLQETQNFQTASAYAKSQHDEGGIKADRALQDITDALKALATSDPQRLSAILRSIHQHVPKESGLDIGIQQLVKYLGSLTPQSELPEAQ